MSTSNLDPVQKNRRQKNWTLFVILLGLVCLFYFIAIHRMAL